MSYIIIGSLNKGRVVSFHSFLKKETVDEKWKFLVSLLSFSKKTETYRNGVLFQNSIIKLKDVLQFHKQISNGNFFHNFDVL